MPKNSRYVVGLDIGTTTICCVVCEVQDSGAVRIVGLGEAPSRGLRKGVVVNLEAAALPGRTMTLPADSGSTGACGLTPSFQ